MGKEATVSPRLGVVALAAIVFGAIIGGGIYNIAQNMAEFAGLGASMVAWGITGGGFLLLVLTFRILARKRPDLHAGIYQYAQAGFGNYMGFNMAWGYWLCAAMGNVGFVVMLCQTLGSLWPPLLHGGWPMLAVGSAIIWGMCWAVAAGAKSPTAMNTFLSALKLGSLVLIVAMLALGFRAHLFTTDIWGHSAPLGSVLHQVRGTMLITLWCFIGIEGAVVMSARARRAADVGRASVLGFLAALALYVAVTALCYGAMARAQLAGLPNPSVAYVLRAVAGPWAYWAVIGAVLLSLGGGLVAWTLVCSQTPYTAAQARILPRVFMRTNRRGTPIFALLTSSLAMQLFLIVVVTAQQVYIAAVELTGMMALPPYLFCGLYLLKGAWGRRHPFRVPSRAMLWWMRTLGAATTLFCCWLIYAGGLQLMLLTSILYAAGAFFYMEARRTYRRSPSEPVFTQAELFLLILLFCFAGHSLLQLFTGAVTL